MEIKFHKVGNRYIRAIYFMFFKQFVTLQNVNKIPVNRGHQISNLTSKIEKFITKNNLASKKRSSLKILPFLNFVSFLFNVDRVAY